MSLVTTELVQQRFKDVLTQIKTPEARKEINKKDSYLKDAEAALISRNMICPLTQIQNTQPLLGGLKPQEFKQLLSREFYNADVMKKAFCIFGSIYYGQPNDNNLVTPNMRTRYWLRNIQKSTSNSKSSDATYKVDLLNAEDILMIKVPIKQNQNLIHEYFIGVYGTNLLRKYIPNFAYILGGFKCSPMVLNPLEKEKKEVITWCNNNKVVINYILYENIEPSISLRLYVKDCKPSEFLNKYLQILYALHKANTLIDFTHYDLHYENVMLRKTEYSKFIIPYETEKGMEYLITDSIATIIDYSYSHISLKLQEDIKQNGTVEQVVKKRHFGINSKLAYGIFPGRKYALHDSYKLLLFCMNEMYKSGNMACFQTGAQILKFFNINERAEDVVAKQRDTYYYLPYTKELDNLNNLNLAQYIRQKFPNETNLFIVSNPGTLDTTKIIKCDGQNVCTNVSEMIKRIGLDGSNPNTVFEFYDAMTLSEEQGNTQLINAIKNNFNYNLAMQEFTNNYNKSINSIRDRLRSLKIYSLAGSSPEAIFNSDFLKIYQNHVTNVATILDESQEIETTINAGIYTAQTYNDTQLADRLKEGLTTLQQKYKPYLKQANVSLQKDRDWLDQLKNISFVKTAIDMNHNLQWFYSGLNNFFYMFI